MEAALVATTNFLPLLSGGHDDLIFGLDKICDFSIA